jgi:hypothetical protein
MSHDEFSDAAGTANWRGYRAESEAAVMRVTQIGETGGQSESYADASGGVVLG